MPTYKWQSGTVLWDSLSYVTILSYSFGEPLLAVLLTVMCTTNGRLTVHHEFSFCPQLCFFISAIKLSLLWLLLDNSPNGRDGDSHNSQAFISKCDKIVWCTTWKYHWLSITNILLSLWHGMKLFIKVFLLLSLKPLVYNSPKKWTWPLTIQPYNV